VTDASLTISAYVLDDALAPPRSVDDVVLWRWLCSCGAANAAIDAATARDSLLGHLLSKHGSTRALVVGEVRRCSESLLAYVERQILD
jgi:hypothetical protein